MYSKSDRTHFLHYKYVFEDTKFNCLPQSINLVVTTNLSCILHENTSSQIIFDADERGRENKKNKNKVRATRIRIADCHVLVVRKWCHPFDRNFCSSKFNDRKIIKFLLAM